MFLSATVKDARHYRNEVQEAVRQIEIAVFLQEEWNVGASLAIELCLNRLCQSDGYVGIFGFRYGWVPSNSPKSITELECEKAFAHWAKIPDPPIFIFLPNPGSVAAKELESFADEALTQDYPEEAANPVKSKDRRIDSKERQKAFCNRLRNSERFIRGFGTLGELRERAIASVSNWNLIQLRNAKQGRHEALSAIPPNERGAIDRNAQRKVLERALAALYGSNSPAMAVVVHGDEDMGHTDFLAWLGSWADWETDSGVIWITPPHDRIDISDLILTAICSLSVGQRDVATDISVLAQVVLERCLLEPVVLMLKNLDRLPGGLEILHREFWLPLFAALHKLSSTAKPRYRMTLVVNIRETLKSPYPLHIWSNSIPAPSLDFSRLIPLPPLAPFVVDDIEEWLKRCEISLHRRAEIAQRVIGSGDPLKVFDRLNAEGFWGELASGGRR